MASKWSVHICGPWSLNNSCREFGCARIEIGIAWFHLGIALTPGSRYAGKLHEPPRWISFSGARK